MFLHWQKLEGNLHRLDHLHFELQLHCHLNHLEMMMRAVMVDLTLSQLVYQKEVMELVSVMKAWVMPGKMAVMVKEGV